MNLRELQKAFAAKLFWLRRTAEYGMLGDTEWAAITEEFMAVFFDELEKKDMGVINELAMQTSASDVGTYNWLASLPEMKQFAGETVFQKLQAKAMSVTNYAYTNGIEVSKDDFQRDKLGMIIPRLQGMAGEANFAKLKALRDDLNHAFTTFLAWDGVPLCGAHTGLTNGGVDTLTMTRLNTDIATLRGATDIEGHELDVNPTHLIVGADQEAKANALYINDRDPDNAATAANTLKGRLKPLVIPGITAGYWFIADLSKPHMKPLILQSQNPVENGQTSLGMTNVWTKNGVEFTADASQWASKRLARFAGEVKFGHGAAFYPLIYGSVGTG